jgi:predicted nucleotidyltransferase
MQNHLSDLVGVNVDLVLKRTLKPAIGKRILAEVVYP